MAKNDNLSDYLLDIANAIREKKGTSEPINAQDFSSEIASIETGSEGGGVLTVASEKDVNFRNYDGTILYSYTKEEFLQLEELPPLPVQEHFICGGWNHNLDEAKTVVNTYGEIEIGGFFFPSDGKSRMYINILSTAHLTVPLYFLQSKNNPVIIDWGDGSPLESVENTWASASHTYNKIGEYIITFEGYISFGSAANESGILGTDQGICNILTRVELADGSGIGEYGFMGCNSLSLVTGKIHSVSEKAFMNCSSLKYICLNTNTISASSFENCKSLSVVSMLLSKGSSGGVGASSFSNCSSLNKISLHLKSHIYENAFYYCTSLCKVNLFDSYSSEAKLEDSAFFGCTSLRYIKILKGLKSIQNYALSLSNACVIDMTAYTQVPTLASSKAIEVPYYCKIVVLDEAYDAFISKQYWNELASSSRIVKASEFYA